MGEFGRRGGRCLAAGVEVVGVSGGGSDLCLWGFEDSWVGELGVANIDLVIFRGLAILAVGSSSCPWVVTTCLLRMGHAAKWRAVRRPPNSFIAELAQLDTGQWTRVILYTP